MSNRMDLNVIVYDEEVQELNLCLVSKIRGSVTIVIDDSLSLLRKILLGLQKIG